MAGSDLAGHQVLLAQAAGRIPLEIGVEDGSAAGGAMPVGALAQELECAVDAVEHGGRTGQFGLVALLHGAQGSAGTAPRGAHRDRIAVRATCRGVPALRNVTA
jgi:hypothetical protein